MTGDALRDSITLLEEIVAKDPATALYLPLAERLREEGRVDDAVRLCEERRSRPGSGVGDSVVLGRCYLAAGRLADALAAFEQALSLDRENVAALKALAGILAHQGEHARAADLYRAVCRVDPGDLESQSALHQITSGDYPEARGPEIVIEQGEVNWQPVQLPREEEHLAELSLGLRTIEVFDAAAPLPYSAKVQDFREVAIGSSDTEPSSAGVPGPGMAPGGCPRPEPGQSPEGDWGSEPEGELTRLGPAEAPSARSGPGATIEEGSASLDPIATSRKSCTLAE
jgi:tetratricopeptide (TPR) repeat protein